MFTSGRRTHSHTFINYLKKIVSYLTNGSIRNQQVKNSWNVVIVFVSRVRFSADSYRIPLLHQNLTHTKSQVVPKLIALDIVR